LPSLGDTEPYSPVPSVCVPGASQNVVPAGFSEVFAVRSASTSGSTSTAPAGGSAGPGSVFPHTAATGPAGAADGAGSCAAAVHDTSNGTHAPSRARRAHCGLRTANLRTGYLSGGNGAR
jgi:hypothetical protein